MKYFIVSDIHGSLSAIESILEQYKKQHCNMLIILGDILNYGPRNGVPSDLSPLNIAYKLNEIAKEVIAVRGNCDSEVDQMLLDIPILSDYVYMIENGKKIFLTHGHIYNETNMPKNEPDLFFYGHTHLWKLEKQGNTVICNTGSVTFPKKENPPTFAIFENNIVTVYKLDGTPLKSMSL